MNVDVCGFQLYPDSTMLLGDFLQKAVGMFVDNKLTETACIDIFDLISDILPAGHNVPKYMRMKRTLAQSLDVDVITACMNDCCLYWGELVAATQCPACRTLRSHPNNKQFRYVGVQRCMEFMWKHAVIGPNMLMPGPKCTTCDTRCVSGKCKPHTCASLPKEPIVKNIWQSRAWLRATVESGFIDGVDAATGVRIRTVLLAFSTDGTNPFKGMGTDYSMWPFIFEVLNLPESMRYQANHMLLAGIVPGPKKPSSLNVYLEHVVQELLKLYEGVLMKDWKGRDILVRCKLLFTIADYPGHCLTNCQSGTNAYHGCIKCNIIVRAC